MPAPTRKMDVVLLVDDSDSVSVLIKVIYDKYLYQKDGRLTLVSSS